MVIVRVLKTRKRVAMVIVRVPKILKRVAMEIVRVLNIPRRVAMVTARDLVGRRDRVEKSILVIADRVMAIRIAARTCRGMARVDRNVKDRRPTWATAVARRCLRWRVVRVAMIAVAPARVVKAARAFIAAREIGTVARPCSARRVVKAASSPRSVDIAVRRVVTAHVVAVISARRIVRWKAVASSSVVRSVTKVRSAVKARLTAKALKITMARIIAAVRRPITARSAVVSTVRGLKAIASIQKPVLPAANRVRAAVVRHLLRKVVVPSRAEPDRGL